MKTLRSLLVLLLLAPATLAEAPDPDLPFDLDALRSWTVLDAGETVPYREEGIRSELLASYRSPSGSYLFVTRSDNTLHVPAFTPEEMRGMFEPAYFSDLEPSEFETSVARQAHGEDGTLEWMMNSFLADDMPYEAGTGDGPVLARGAFLPVVLASDGGGYANLLYVVNFRGAPDASEDLDVFRRVWTSFRVPNGRRLVAAESFNALRPELIERAAAEPASPPAEEPPVSMGAGGPPDDLLALLHQVVASVGAPDPSTTPAPDTVVGRVYATLQDEAEGTFQRRVWDVAFQRAQPDLRPRLAALFLAESLRSGNLELAAAVTASALEAGMDGGAVLCAEPERILAGLTASPLRGSPSDPTLASVLSLDAASRCRPFQSRLAQRTGALPLADLVRERRGGWLLRPDRSADDLPRAARDGDRWLVVRHQRRQRVVLEEVGNLLQLASLLR